MILIITAHTPSVCGGGTGLTSAAAGGALEGNGGIREQKTLCYSVSYAQTAEGGAGDSVGGGELGQ